MKLYNSFWKLYNFLRKLYKFPRKLYNFPGKLCKFPRKFCNFLRKLYKFPRKFCNFLRKLCKFPRKFCNFPGMLYKFPWKSCNFPGKLYKFPGNFFKILRDFSNSILEKRKVLNLFLVIKSTIWKKSRGAKDTFWYLLDVSTFEGILFNDRQISPSAVIIFFNAIWFFLTMPIKNQSSISLFLI